MRGYLQALDPGPWSKAQHLVAVRRYPVQEL